MIRIGPAGVTDGWAWDDGGKDKIVQIFIAHGDCIDFLQYLYVDQNGNLVLSSSHGGTFGTSKFDLVSVRTTHLVILDCNRPTQRVVYSMSKKKKRSCLFFLVPYAH